MQLKNSDALLKLTSLREDIVDFGVKVKYYLKIKIKYKNVINF